MTQDAYCVSPDTSLTSVAGVMAEKKYGCAVVIDHGEVVGVFTAIDALRALSEVSQQPSRRPTPRTHARH